MVTIYTTPSCSSCRKAKAWLEEHQIEYVERKIVYEPLTEDEIKSILRLTDEGTEEIISQNSKTFQRLNIDINSLPLKELYQLLSKYPKMLRSPILQDHKRLVVGYNEEEIRSFLPRRVRTFLFDQSKHAAN